MRLKLQPRRLAHPVSGLICSYGQSVLPFRPLGQVRCAADKADKSDKPVLDPSDPQSQDHNPYMKKLMLKRQDAEEANQEITQDELLSPRGQLASKSVFAEDFEIYKSAGEVVKPEEPAKEVDVPHLDGPFEVLQSALDPNPAARKKWQAKKVIQSFQKRHKMTKEEIIKQTERESANHSKWHWTSTKKLGMLARQIQGKTLEEAAVQMRFSKKRHAQPIKEFLEDAKNFAVVSKGMGLGQDENRPIDIRLKDGSKRKITNKSQMYIDRAWVVRGAYLPEPEYRAKGRVNILRHPQARVHVVLKEEATRIRLHKEREQKRQNRKLWTQLPDRPITAQRQYCLW